MKIVTRQMAINNLRQYLKEDLADYAPKFNVTIFNNGKQNKGWKGQVLEHLAGLDINNKQAPNGLGFELKSVAFQTLKNGNLVPKETMAITMINPQEVVETPFYDSHCWHKLKSLVFCKVMWHGNFVAKSELLSVSSFDFIENDNIINEIKADYELIQNTIKTSGFHALTGKMGKWIQPRTKGTGHGSKTRAFYARKELVKYIVDVDS